MLYTFRTDCICGEIETIEHYLLNCENYFNEREKMKTTLFKHAGIVELSTELLLGCNDTDLKKEFDLTILSALGDFITQDCTFLTSAPTTTYRELVT